MFVIVITIICCFIILLLFVWLFILFYLKIDRLRSHHCWLYNVDIWIWMFVSARTHATKRTKWVNAYRLTHALLCVCVVYAYFLTSLCVRLSICTLWLHSLFWIILTDEPRARSLFLSLALRSHLCSLDKMHCVNNDY